MDPTLLRNRLVIATSMWRETTEEPLPRLAKAEPETQIEELELKLVDLLCSDATAENARETAERTWDLVHDRPDGDRVKRRVSECHERLAELSRAGDDGDSPSPPS